jgi:hypothetical protein
MPATSEPREGSTTEGAAVQHPTAATTGDECGIPCVPVRGASAWSHVVAPMACGRFSRSVSSRLWETYGTGPPVSCRGWVEWTPIHPRSS